MKTPRSNTFLILKAQMLDLGGRSQTGNEVSSGSVGCRIELSSCQLAGLAWLALPCLSGIRRQTTLDSTRLNSTPLPPVQPSREKYSTESSTVIVLLTTGTMSSIKLGKFVYLVGSLSIQDHADATLNCFIPNSVPCHPPNPHPTHPSATLLCPPILLLPPPSKR